MRRVRYVVAMSLDGYIAGLQDEYDWIIMDPEIDFEGLIASCDTALLGRRSFEAVVAQGESGSEMFGLRTIVFSRTLRQEDYPDVDIRSDAVERVTELLGEDGGDIWLFGGGGLFRSLLEADLVDTVEVGVIPILLGGGVPLLPSTSRSVRLQLTDTRTYPTGIVSLNYDVDSSSP